MLLPLERLYGFFQKECADVRTPSDRRNLWFHYVMLERGMAYPERWTLVESLIQRKLREYQDQPLESVFRQWQEISRKNPAERSRAILSPEWQRQRSATPLAPLMLPRERNLAHRFFVLHEYTPD